MSIEERAQIITAAAKPIISKICCADFDNDFYPTAEDLQSGREILPSFLRLPVES